MNVVGIDIGGTKTSIGIVDIKKGKVLSKIIIPSKKFKDDKKNLDNIIITTIELIDNKKIKNIGIGVPELINNKGVIKGNYNFNWKNKKLINFFPNKYNVIVDSDVRCHLRAEKFYGHGQKFRNFIYINIGTGLSYSHFKNNQIYTGANGYAIHFASSKITLYNPVNNKKISLIPENFYSGKAIMTFLKKFKQSKKQDLLFNNIADSLGSLIGNLINSIDPELIVMGGGVVNNNFKFRNLLIKYTRNYILSEDVKKIKILISKSKDDTGLLGAAAVFK
jgi:glucokinase